MKITREHGLIHVTYESQEQLAKAFCRFQEHYENPEFRGKIFTLGQLREWYCNHHGAWTYYTDWAGFNIPSSVLNKFRDGMFDPLSKAEKELLNALAPIPGRFYIIGTTEDSDTETINHERLHALYYTNEDYKAEINSILGITFPAKLSPLRNHLRELGYHESVIDDEVQAYLGSSTDYLDEKGLDYPKHIAQTIKKTAERYLQPENAL